MQTKNFGWRELVSGGGGGHPIFSFLTAIDPRLEPSSKLRRHVPVDIAMEYYDLYVTGNEPISLYIYNNTEYKAY